MQATKVLCRGCGADVTAADEMEAGICHVCATRAERPKHERVAPLPPVFADAVRVECSPLGWVGAIAGAVLGAIAWAAIVLITNYEVGYVAVGIGALVGVGAVALGGRGTPLAVSAGVLALAAILAGKGIATQMLLDRGADDAVTTTATPANYARVQANAAALANLGDDPTDKQLLLFMMGHGFVEMSQASMDKVASFRSDTLPVLRKFAAEEPSFDVWKSEMQARVSAVQVSVWGTVLDGLSPIDLLFAFLGISTAVGMVLRRTREDAAAV